MSEMFFWDTSIVIINYSVTEAQLRLPIVSRGRLVWRLWGNIEIAKHSTAYNYFRARIRTVFVLWLGPKPPESSPLTNIFSQLKAQPTTKPAVWLGITKNNTDKHEAQLPQRELTSNSALSYGAKGMSYVEPFGRESRVWQTNRQMDGQTV